MCTRAAVGNFLHPRSFRNIPIFSTKWTLDSGLFLAPEHPAQVEGVSMLDGYLTAIVIAPRSIPPDEWFGDLCGARGNIAVASGTMLAAITSILARFNAINEGLSTKPPRHAPMFRKTDEGLAVPNLWCMGFLRECGCGWTAGNRCWIRTASTMGSCCRSCSTVLIHQAVRCSDRLGRDAKPRSFSARRTRTSRLSCPRSRSSGCQNGCAR